MKVKINKIIELACTLLLCIGITVCSMGDTMKSKFVSGSDESQKSIVFWGAPATEKILQNKQPEYYNSIKTPAKLSLSVMKGEYESSQIIITANGGGDFYYDIQLSDLTSENGNTYSKDNILVYHERYQELTIYENNGAPKGAYPDAIVPFNAIKTKGENIVRNGKNQGIYFTFHTPVNQKSDTYIGNFIIKYDNNNEVIPVNIQVIDLTVSQENHSKSWFSLGWEYASGELDSTQHIYDRYMDKLLEYRLDAGILVHSSQNSDEEIKYYAEKAYELMQDERCSVVGIPTIADYSNGLNLNKEIFNKYLDAFIEESFKNNYNMFNKVIVYMGSIIDEPDNNPNTIQNVKRVCNTFNSAVVDKANAVREDVNKDESLRNEMADSISKIHNIVTSAYNKTYNGIIDSWCPLVNFYDTESSRANYDSQEEKWWYTCVGPRAPYPTYHTEDTLLSARALGWMQADYNVVGNLFWACNIYAFYDGSKYNPIDDYYDFPSRFPKVNGDGYLFYPGKQYGIDGPVASLRLEAIRDGLEEYEIFRDLKQKYEQAQQDSGVALNIKSSLQGITGLIYNGTQVNTDSKRFMNARDSLIQLDSMASSKAKACIVNYKEDELGNLNYKILVNNGYCVKYGGNICDVYRQANNGKIYNVNIERNSDVIESNIMICDNDGNKISEFIPDVGGKVKVLKAEDLLSGYKSDGGVTPQVSLQDVSSIILGNTNKTTKIILPETTAITTQSVRLENNDLKLIDSKYVSGKLFIYSKGELEGQTITIRAKTSKQKLYFELGSVSLHSGITILNMQLGGINWNNIGNIEYLSIVVESKKAIGLSEKTVYFGNLVFYEGGTAK